MKKEVLYSIVDFEDKAIVIECTRQKEILEYLDNALELVDEDSEYGQFNWDVIFADDSFYITYTDGSFYSCGWDGEYGKYKKKGIERIIYTNAYDVMVYGDYEVNEWGCVS